MNTRMQPITAPARRLRPLLGALLLGFAWASAGPARAVTVDSTNSPFTVDETNSPFTETIFVNAGGELRIVPGGSVSTSDGFAIISSGKLTMSGGSVTGGAGGIALQGGTVTISKGEVQSPGGVGILVNSGNLTMSGGSVTGPLGINVFGGTVSISGGSIVGWSYGVSLSAGTVSISGCGLQLFDTDIYNQRILTGFLADGTEINTKTSGLTAANLQISGDCDVSAPTTTAKVTNETDGTDYQAGTWTKQNVKVVLNTFDIGKGVKELVYSATGAQPIDETRDTDGATDVTLTQEGTTTLRFFARDNAGNVENPAKIFTVQIDRTPPVVTYSGNAGIYTVDQMVTITCSATDTLSGVASHTCQNITGPAYSFNLGANPYSATATDSAGNTGGGSTSFTVQVTPSSLSGLVSQFVTDPAVVKGLQDKLATIAQAKGKSKAAAVEAFISQVDAQTGKSLTAAQAEILIQLVRAL